MNESTMDSTGAAMPPIDETMMADDTLRREPGPLERLLLAGVGAVADACDQAEDRFERYVDRGQQVQDEIRERTGEIRRQNRGVRGRARGYFRGAVEAFLDSLSVPNKADVDTINVKLNILTRKIDDLQMEGLRATTPGQPPSITPGDTTPGQVIADADEDLAT